MASDLDMIITDAGELLGQMAEGIMLSALRLRINM